MEFEIACTCGQHMMVDAQHVRETVVCPGCGGHLSVPSPPSPGQQPPVVAPRSGGGSAACPAPSVGDVASPPAPEQVGYAGFPALEAKPGKVTAIGGMRLGSGIANLIMGAALSGCISPLLLIPFGICEIISGANLLRQRPGPASNSKLIPIPETCAIAALSVPALVIGIISLVFMSDPVVDRCMALLNSRRQS